MTFYYQRQGTQEQKITLEKAMKKMDLYYKQYNAIYKRLSKVERNFLWSKYINSKKEIEEIFKPFGFIC